VKVLLWLLILWLKFVFWLVLLHVFFESARSPANLLLNKLLGASRELGNRLSYSLGLGSSYFLRCSCCFHCFHGRLHFWFRLDRLLAKVLEADIRCGLVDLLVVRQTNHRLVLLVMSLRWLKDGQHLVDRRLLLLLRMVIHERLLLNEAMGGCDDWLFMVDGLAVCEGRHVVLSGGDARGRMRHHHGLVLVLLAASPRLVTVGFRKFVLRI